MPPSPPPAPTISDTDLENATPEQLLFLAASLGRTDLVVTALRLNAPIDALTPLPSNPAHFQTALHAAVRNAHIDVTRALLASSASPDIPDSAGNTVIHYLPPASEHPHLSNVFATELCQKAARGDVNGLNRLIDAGLDVNVLDSPQLSNSPLHWAATFGAVSCIRALLSKGAEVDPVNAAGNTPLLDAVVAGHVDAVTILLDAGADLSLTNHKGHSVLDLSVSDDMKTAIHSRDKIKQSPVLPLHGVAPPNGTDLALPDHTPPTPYFVPGERPFRPMKEAVPDWCRYLWPRPQRFVEAHGTFSVPPVVTVSAESACMPVAHMFVRWLRDLKLLDMSVRLVGGGQGGLCEGIAFSAVVFLRIDTCALHCSEQAYSLTVRRFGIDVVASDLCGLFYACSTMLNLFSFCKNNSHGVAPLSIPTCNITDWPSVRRRGLYLDISGRRVPTMNTLKELVEFMALRLKMNQLQLNVGANFGKLKGVSRKEMLKHEDILELSRFCSEHFIELVPVAHSNDHLQTSGKHFSSPLVNGDVQHASVGIAEMKLVEREMMFDEFIPLFDSKQVNLGDITNLPQCDKADFERLRNLSKSLRSRGKMAVHVFANKLVESLSTPSEYSSTLAELPARCIMILEADDLNCSTFEDNCLQLRQNGLPFYTCASTFLDHSIAGRLSKCIKKGQHAIKTATDHGAAGVLIKDSSFCNEGAPLIFMYLMLLPLAGASWNSEHNISISQDGPDELLGQLYDTYIFKDRPEKGMLGTIATSLGDLHQIAGDSRGILLFQLLAQRPNSKSTTLEQLPYLGLRRAVKRADRIENALSSYSGNAKDSDVLELRLSALHLAVSSRIGALLVSLASAASMEGKKKPIDENNDLSALPDGRRSDLCNALLQAIECLRISWMERYHLVGFTETVELTVGETLSKLAHGMPYEQYLEERKAEHWVPTEE